MTAAASGPAAATGTALPSSPPAPAAGAVPAPTSASTSAPVSSPRSTPTSPSIPARPHAPDHLRRALGAACRPDEAQCVAALVAEWQEYARALDPAQVAALARRLVTAVRARRGGLRDACAVPGADRLMQEFALSSQEGVALMCLAEALLRIPDAATAERLIRDKIGGKDWRAHLGHSASPFVNAAAWGLLLTGQLLAPRQAAGLPGALTRLLARGGEPLIRHGVDFAMRLLGRQFVIAEDIAGALARSREAEARGYTHSFDMLGEAALTAADAARYLRAYTDALHAIGRAGAGRGVHAGPGLSIKLSALHPRYCRAQRARVEAELLPRLKTLLLLAKHYDVGVNIDAEEADRLELSFDLLAALAADPELAGWQGLGCVVQAYQKRAPALIDALIALARRSGRRLMVRLVKGAYWDGEIKRAQVDGLSDYPVYTRKAHTDLAYLVCAGRLLAAPDAIYAQFATHNAHTLACVHRLAAARGAAGPTPGHEFQCLYGMGETLYDQAVGAAQLGLPCRIYAPVGSHATLLPYLVRRLLENGANSAFVRRLVDPAVSVEQLIADPLHAVLRDGGTRHPAIPPPPALYGARRNSAGVDLADDATLAALTDELAALRARRWHAAPLLAGPPAAAGTETRPVRNPADRAEVVGDVREASVEETARAVAHAADFAETWHRTPAGARADPLEAAADRLEAQRGELVSLLVREAGKTWPNAIGEVREAVDFCRYYAQQARTAERLTAAPAAAPGPVACISPWNFPLAIFVGQLGAALAAGSPVLAKPARQTPLIAAFAVELFHRAGVPVAALQLLPGRGEIVGAALAANPRVRDVIFTGSTEVARQIDMALAARPPGAPEARLIAETGGLNAMLVDSSALPEQVVQDVLSSAFDSAGQRCSALRLLCLQEEIAGPVLEMLRGALRELAIGDPGALATDLGPVIDAAAQAGIAAHVATLRAAGRPVFQPPLPAACARGSFVAPTLIEIETAAELEREVFGPVLHVLRFRAKGAKDFDAQIDAINAGGYGLTFGLHTRIDATVARVAARIRAGNVYVNRNMIGAVVGVQPFGGEGKSGTGPKAGGPLYLHRLLDSAQVPPAGIGATVERDAPPELAPFRALHAWALAGRRTALAAACAAYADLTLLPWRIDLPGPTGERNTQRFAPRGGVLCLAAGDAARLAQIAAALATGNRALLPDTPAARALRARLPAAARRAVDVLAEDAALAACAAVLFDAAEREGEEDAAERAGKDAAEDGTKSAATKACAGAIDGGSQADGAGGSPVATTPSTGTTITTAATTTATTAAEAEAEAALRRRLAQRAGARVPLLVRRAGHSRYPLYRLVVERVLSVNTAAAGGNAALMELGA